MNKYLPTGPLSNVALSEVSLLLMHHDPVAERFNTATKKLNRIYYSEKTHTQVQGKNRKKYFLLENRLDRISLNWRDLATFRGSGSKCMPAVIEANVYYQDVISYGDK